MNIFIRFLCRLVNSFSSNIEYVIYVYTVLLHQFDIELKDDRNLIEIFNRVINITNKDNYDEVKDDKNTLALVTRYIKNREASMW